MKYYDFISVSAFPALQHWMLHVRFRVSEGDTAPAWHHLKARVVLDDTDSLEGILEAIGEELFNWSPLTEEAGYASTLRPLPSGGTPTLALTPDD